MEDLDDPDRFIDLAAFASMLEHAAIKIGEPCFGLRCAQDYPINAISLLGFIIHNAPSTHEALNAMTRYLRLIIAPVYTSSRIEDGLYYWTLSFPQNFTAPRLQFDLFVLATFIRRLSYGAGPGWHLEQLDLSHDDPGCPELCAKLLAPRIRFNQPQVTLVLDEGALNSRSRNADARLYVILKQHAEDLLKKTPDPSNIVELVRHQIELRLSHETTDLEVIAQALGLSVRMLQLKLARQNTSFTQILEDVRGKLAKYYLTDTDLRMTEIAYLLGFSETSAFTRAAPRWIGMSPQAYRRSIGK